MGAMSNKCSYSVGDLIRWKWMGGYIEGEILELYFEPVVKNIKGKNIKRNGSPERPAFLVKSVAGNLALKLVSEIEPNKPTRRTYKGNII